jgi:hypothetical protein
MNIYPPLTKTVKFPFSSGFTLVLTINLPLYEVNDLKPPGFAAP